MALRTISVMSLSKVGHDLGVCAPGRELGVRGDKGRRPERAIGGCGIRVASSSRSDKSEHESEIKRAIVLEALRIGRRGRKWPEGPATAFDDEAVAPAASAAATAFLIHSTICSSSHSSSCS